MPVAIILLILGLFGVVSSFGALILVGESEGITMLIISCVAAAGSIAWIFKLRRPAWVTVDEDPLTPAGSAEGDAIFNDESTEKKVNSGVDRALARTLLAVSALTVSFFIGQKTAHARFMPSMSGYAATLHALLAITTLGVSFSRRGTRLPLTGSIGGILVFWSCVHALIVGKLSAIAAPAVLTSAWIWFLAIEAKSPVSD